VEVDALEIVSILDLLEVGFRLTWWRRGKCRHRVSILDLLEVGFRRLQIDQQIADLQSFNPWFVGSRIQTNIRVKIYLPSIWFQSLICWKSDSDRNVINQPPGAGSGFNPWFVGSRIQTIFFRANTITNMSFNPWFVGSRIQTLIIRWNGMNLMEVSILDLLEVGFRLGKVGSFAAAKIAFQSLICWKSDSDILCRFQSDWRCRRFNPWFVGSRIQTRISSPDGKRTNPVSILDLLEVGFRHSYASCVYYHSSCFNPWFVGSRIQTDANLKIDLALTNRFNPWFVGSRIQTSGRGWRCPERIRRFNPWFVGSRIQTTIPTLMRS